MPLPLHPHSAAYSIADFQTFSCMPRRNSLPLLTGVPGIHHVAHRKQRANNVFAHGACPMHSTTIQPRPRWVSSTPWAVPRLASYRPVAHLTLASSTSDRQRCADRPPRTSATCGRCQTKNPPPGTGLLLVVPPPTVVSDVHAILRQR